MSTPHQQVQPVIPNTLFPAQLPLQQWPRLCKCLVYRPHASLANRNVTTLTAQSHTLICTIQGGKAGNDVIPP